MNLPNSLTVLRLLLAPAIFWMIVSGRYSTAAAMVAIAGSTDFLDGWLARNWNQISKFGQFADPLADKVLLSGTFLAFGVAGAVPLWLVVLVFGRDAYLLMATFIAMKFTRLREYRPSRVGKLNTAIQILYVVLLLLSEAFENSTLHSLADLLVWPVAVLAVFTGVHYTVRGIVQLAHD